MYKAKGVVMMEERRRQRRIAYPVKVSIRIEGEGAIEVFHTENISIGGIRIISPKHLDRNTPVDVVLDLGETMIKTSGRVAWFLEIKPSDSQHSTLYDMGIEFVGIAPDDRQIIDQLLNKVERHGS